MDLKGIADTLSNLGALDKSLYGVAIVIAVVLRFLRAYFEDFGDPQTFLAAMSLGVLGAGLNLGFSRGTWGSSLFQGIALGAGVLVLELVLRKMGEKVPWLPSDNQHIKPKEDK